MPSRPRACSEAVRCICKPAKPLLWITDEVLDNAFQRFLRISRTAKRYGSNVPGPLEAQRRLAKRRIMAAAAPWGAPTVDATALFGAGPPAREQLRWEPPAPAQTTREPNGNGNHHGFIAFTNLT